VKQKPLKAGYSPRPLFPWHLHKIWYVGGLAQKTFAQLSSRAEIGLKGIQDSFLMLLFSPHVLFQEIPQFAVGCTIQDR
jgi:hypothetical protein